MFPLLTIIILVIKLMKYTRERFYPQSAMSNYEVGENVSGWECFNYAPPSENIFKQLKVNLNKYEQQYNHEQSLRNKNYSQKVNPLRYLQQKQNEAKSSLLFHSTPLKHLLVSREPFEIKCRNILQDALAYNQTSEAKQFRITRLSKKRKSQKSEEQKVRAVLKRSLLDSDFSDSKMVSHKRRYVW